MKRLGAFLQKKFSQPQFKKALIFGRIKECVEEFFSKKGLPVWLIEFDDKNQSIAIKTAHPSIARELLGYQRTLNSALKKEGLPSIKTIRTSIK
ncbi:MAG: hypothetical protein HYZ69_02190 [Candidatus Colwellbacteria bacterium]|nr:hypothetical protein [Candidatus Colwellbacteria bacterium]